MEYQDLIFQIPLPNLEGYFRQRYTFLNGQSEALFFASKSNFDISVINSAIQETKEKMSYFNFAGPMGDLATPRTYQEGYLKGLQEAKARILQGHDI